jgi:drug/metabolite transporter (DMT)-like permease
MERTTLIGVGGALGVTCIWTGWIVVTRYGVTNALNPYDLAAMRFGIAGILVLPWVIKNRTWAGLTPGRVAVLAVCAGFPYALVSYFGFAFAPAAHGGVFMNGALPAFTVIIAWLWARDRIHRSQALGLIAIGAGTVLVGSGALFESGLGQSWIGDLLFLAATAFLAVYMVATKVWNITAGQMLFGVTVVNAALYVPAWALFLDSNISVAPLNEILLQAVYQGLMPSFVGMYFMLLAVRHLGANRAAVFVSMVPVLAALLAVPTLGEIPSSVAWSGMVLVTLGALLALGLFRSRTSPLTAGETPKTG